jgi:hypothetical protein
LVEGDNPIHVMDKWMPSFILQPFVHKDNEGRRQQHNAANKK